MSEALRDHREGERLEQLLVRVIFVLCILSLYAYLVHLHHVTTQRETDVLIEPVNIKIYDRDGESQ